MTAAPLLEVRDLSKHYPVRKGFFGRESGAVRAVDGVSLTPTGCCAPTHSSSAVACSSG